MLSINIFHPRRLAFWALSMMMYEVREKLRWLC